MKKKLDYVKMLDDIIIDMWPLWDEYKKKCNKIFIQQQILSYHLFDLTSSPYLI